AAFTETVFTDDPPQTWSADKLVDFLCQLHAKVANHLYQEKAAVFSNETAGKFRTDISFTLRHPPKNAGYNLPNQFGRIQQFLQQC
ncbi:hypothetical protein ABTK33_20685, partial [Acinetobacter baumannii]